jgi:hypothetical protein
MCGSYLHFDEKADRNRAQLARSNYRIPEYDVRV